MGSGCKGWLMHREAREVNKDQMVRGPDVYDEEWGLVPETGGHRKLLRRERPGQTYEFS